MKPQLLFRVESCVACGLCVEVCPQGAVATADGIAHTDRSKCTACGLCVASCAGKARSVAGKYMTSGEVFDEVVTDRMFYDNSGGGVTLSGGEVLSQPEFAADILRQCMESGIHTAIETSGFANPDIVREVVKWADLVLYDIKHMDTIAHMHGTGVPNDRILRNVRTIRRELGKPVTIRIPLIPGYNDSESNLRATAVFVVNELGSDTAIELLPYHRLGEGKRVQLEEMHGDFSAVPPDDDAMEKARMVFIDIGLAAKIGG
jgi:pyruvate formate lyase activating enzyme